MAGEKPLALRLSAWGRGLELHRVAAVSPALAGDQARYRHGGVTEWWRVLPIGFEQGFTVETRPSGDGELRLALGASGSTKQHDGVVQWGRLRYGDLVVTDSTGKIMPATLKTTANRVFIAVNDAHAVYPLTVDPLVWVQQQLTASNGAAYDFFGIAVAFSGSTALVGADGVTVNGNADQGAAYIFNESNGVWSQAAMLTASNGASANYFGQSVTISGNTAVIGAPGVNSQQGAAYVFTEANGSWSQAQELTASDGVPSDSFGGHVALSGTTALIGANAATVNGNADQGAAYVFDESGGSWSQTQKLTASDGAAGDFFGISVALSGTTAVVGAAGATINGNTGQGAAYVFDQSGGNWSQTQKLTASNGAAHDNFGGVVALDGSGSAALIGAPGATAHGIPSEGAAYVFDESGGSWSQTQELSPSDGASFDGFANSLSLSGSTALIGAFEDTVNGNFWQGAAYLFTESNGNWAQTQKFVSSDGTTMNWFGISVALSGSTVLVGANIVSVDGNTQEGAAYFFDPSDLSIVINAPGEVGQGQEYTSEAIATNSSSAASPAVAVTVTVPAAASYVSASSSQGSCGEASGTVTCSFGQISGGGGTAMANVTLKATGSAGTTITNSASMATVAPPLAASAPTAIGNCDAGYTEYDGTLSAGAHAIEPGGQPYQAPAGMESGVLTGPAGFQLYLVFQNARYGRHVYHAAGGTLDHWGPSGSYAWIVKAGDTGGSFVFCLKHP